MIYYNANPGVKRGAETEPTEERHAPGPAPADEFADEEPDGGVGWSPGLVCPRCGRRHKLWSAVARCYLRPALWVAGNPPAAGGCYATVSDCGHRAREPMRTV